MAAENIPPANFVINTFDDVGRAIAYMHKHHANAVNDGKPLVVSIDQKQQDRSKAQNRLYDIHAFCLKQGCYLHTPDDLRFAIE